MNDWFDCSFCGCRHYLQRDLTVLESGKFRWPMTKPAVGASKTYEPPDNVVLERAFQYGHAHAKEVVRQIASHTIAKDTKAERIAA